jgi:hypothetical protein
VGNKLPTLLGCLPRFKVKGYNVPYTLEKITEEVQDRIIKDAVDDPPRQSSLIAAKRNRVFDGNWAIDHERNCYLLWDFSRALEEMEDAPYLAFVRGVMYRVRMDGSFRRKIYFHKKKAPADPGLLREVQGEIRSAFKIYGRHGDGPKKDDQGIANLEFIVKEVEPTCR